MSYLEEFKRMAQGRSLPGVSESVKGPADPMKAVEVIIPPVKARIIKTVKEYAKRNEKDGFSEIKTDIVIKEGKDARGPYKQCEVSTLFTLTSYLYSDWRGVDRIEGMDADWIPERLAESVYDDVSKALKAKDSDYGTSQTPDVTFYWPDFDEAELFEDPPAGLKYADQYDDADNDGGDYDTHYTVRIEPFELKYHFFIYPNSQNRGKNVPKRF